MSFITAIELLRCIRHPEDTYEILARAATNQMPWTEIRIHQEENRVWAQYHPFPFLMRKIMGDKVADYLESYQIDLNDPNNDCFSVYHLFRDFSNSTQDPVLPVSIQKYFADVTDAEAYLRGEKSIPAFLSAEAAMVNVLLETYQSDSVFYYPIPMGKNRQLERVVYLIFDREMLDGEQRAALDAFPLEI